jgi:hypothetical protein
VSTIRKKLKQLGLGDSSGQQQHGRKHKFSFRRKADVELLKKQHNFSQKKRDFSKRASLIIDTAVGNSPFKNSTEIGLYVHVNSEDKHEDKHDLLLPGTPLTSAVLENVEPPTTNIEEQKLLLRMFKKAQEVHGNLDAVRSSYPKASDAVYLQLAVLMNASMGFLEGKESKRTAARNPSTSKGKESNKAAALISSPRNRYRTQMRISGSMFHGMLPDKLLPSLKNLTNFICTHQNTKKREILAEVKNTKKKENLSMVRHKRNMAIILPEGSLKNLLPVGLIRRLPKFAYPNVQEHRRSKKDRGECVEVQDSRIFRLTRFS